ncbi:MAG: sulfatase family protein [Planctomycetota bacterium]
MKMLKRKIRAINRWLWCVPLIMGTVVFGEQSGNKVSGKVAKINVVILISDQHAHDVLGCAGFGKIRTPTYDRLAAEGIRFRQTTVAITACVPSRHSLFHGLYAFQTGVYSNGHCIPLEDIPRFTMGRIFRDAGYATGAIGKMHWFPYGAMVPEGSYFGFGYRIGTFQESGQKMITHFVKERSHLMNRYMAERKEHGISFGGDGCSAAYLGYVSKMRSDEFHDWWLAGKAAEFVDAHRAGPFLLVCSLQGPHAPSVVPADYRDLYDAEDPSAVPVPQEPPEDLPDARNYRRFKGLSRGDLKKVVANYMACVTFRDACHGRVIEALERNGLYHNTLIVYCSDHGELLASRGVASFSKYNLYERAIRVPLIIKPPQHMAKSVGRTSDELTSLVDILPTVLEMAGVASVNRLGGISLAPLFAGKKLQRQRKVAFSMFGKGSFTIRSRDWKYILYNNREELYHLADDPLEFHNLAGRPGSAERMSKLKELLLDEYGHVFKSMGAKCKGYKRQKFDFSAR